MASARDIQQLSNSYESARSNSDSQDDSSSDEGITHFFLSSNKFTTGNDANAGGSVKHLYDQTEPETEYVDVITSRLFNQERQEIQYSNEITSRDIVDRMYAILVDWLSDVAVTFKLGFKTFCQGVYMIKYCLADRDFSNDNRNVLQLLGCTCMFIAAKVEELRGNAPQISDWLYISDRAFTKKQFLEMEQRVLVATQFRLFVTPDDFIILFNRILGDSIKRVMLAKYILESGYMNFKLLGKWLPSDLAAGAMYLAEISLNPEIAVIWDSNLTRIELDTAQEVAQDLYDYIWITRDKSLKGAIRKYAKPSTLVVSRILLVNPRYEK